MQIVPRYGTAFLVAHGVVALLHEIAHRRLPVSLPLLNYSIAYAVVAILPVVAMVLLWTSRRRAGVWILLLSMAGSLVYAGLYHFVLNSPDHVSRTPEGSWRPVFQITAVLMLVLEAFGCWLGYWMLGRLKEMPASA